jgi:hypothetical protein
MLQHLSLVDSLNEAPIWKSAKVNKKTGKFYSFYNLIYIIIIILTINILYLTGLLERSESKSLHK